MKNEPYIIAEMACSHEGKISLSKDIIDGAGEAGANAIQFQIWDANEMVSFQNPDLIKLKEIEISYAEWEKLYNYTRENWPKLSIIACVYEEKSINFCESIGIDAYKIHASDLLTENILKSVARTKKRIDLSIGAAKLSEIELAISILKKCLNSNIWLMYGYQLFPTPSNSLNLQYMKNLQKLFGFAVGYQDHCDANKSEAFWLPASVYGMGINIIEKHITHDRSFKGIDHEAALNPSEFKEFTKMLHQIHTSLGNGFPREFTEGEKKYRKYAKKSLVAKHELKKGHKLNYSDLVALRAPKLGMQPNLINELVGKTLLKNIGLHDLVNIEDTL